MSQVFGAIEAGGTKFVCGVGTGPDDLRIVQIPTREPGETVREVVSFFRQSPTPPEAIGIGSFGPVCINRNSSKWGHITTTPKIAWRNFDLAGEIGRALNVPVEFDTDVNAAVLGEREWGAGRGCDNLLYLTVGTGIGGGAMVDGRLLTGFSHPEMGHIRIPRDSSDSFKGCCPYHGDCLEGLASGPAIAARWGESGQQLPDDHAAWMLEAKYLAAGVVSLAAVLSPERVILGGGVMRRQQLREPIRHEADRLVAGYFRVPEIVSPGLGEWSGVLGAIVLARQARISL